MLRLHLVDTDHVLQGLQPAWNAVAAAHCFPSVFLTWEWRYTWWREVGSRQGDTWLYVLAIWQKNRLVGIAPFMERQEGPDRVLRFLGDPYTDYHDVIALPELQRQVVSLVLAHLHAERSRWNRTELHCIPTGSCLVTLSQEAGWLQTAGRAACPVVQFGDPAVFRQLTGKQGQARNARLLAERGALRCDHYFSCAAISDRFDDYRRMHLQQWSGNPEAVGGFDDPLVTGFFAGLVPALSPQRWLMFSALSLDGEALAYYFSFLYAGKYWAYRPCYNTAMAHYSPGHILLKEIISYLRAQSCYTLDLLRGNYAYKYRYANDAQPICSLCS